MTTTSTSNTDHAPWIRSTRSYGGRPSSTEPAWETLERAVGGVPRGSLVIVTADDPHLARVLCLNLVNHKALDEGMPTLFVEPAGTRSDARAIVEANVYGLTVDFVQESGGAFTDELVREGVADAARDAPWIQCSEPDAWLPRLERIQQFRGLNLDLRYVIIDSLMHLEVQGIAGVDGTCDAAKRAALTARALSRLAESEGVTIVAGCPRSITPGLFGRGYAIRDLIDLYTRPDLLLEIELRPGPAPTELDSPAGGVGAEINMLQPDGGAVGIVECIYEAPLARFLARVHADHGRDEDGHGDPARSM